jgi:hypothetical protein
MLPVLICLIAFGFILPLRTTGVFASFLYDCEKDFDIVSINMGRLQGCTISGAAIMDDAKKVVVKAKGVSG